MAAIAVLSALSLLPAHLLVLPRPPASPRTHAFTRRPLVTMGVGDLKGGTDGERNSQIDRLRSLFLSSGAEEAEGTDTRAAAALGMLLDVPLCRWPWEILVHVQQCVNVHEPQYTLMLDQVWNIQLLHNVRDACNPHSCRPLPSHARPQLLATPPPHLYVHLVLPGGTRSLSDPEYELLPDSKAPLVGTLVQVRASKQ